MGQKKVRLINQLVSGLPKLYICRKNGITLDDLEAFVTRNASVLIRRVIELRNRDIK